ncbi:MAG: beta-phosphoglucomutase [Phycisphaerae bacterium]|jgi:beta-phosphoglucomutase
MKFKNIKAIIFDLDGVLTNTSEYHYKAWKMLADKLKIHFDRDINEKLRGIPRKESLEIMLGERIVSEEEKKKLMDIKNNYYVDLLTQMTPDDILPGVLELLQEIRKAGIKIGIGSSSKNAQTVIDKLKLGSFIDSISDGYSVDNHKPAPDLFLHCAANLNTSPKNAIVVEDAESGVEAALNGGFWVIGLGPAERVGKAHIVFPDFKNVHLQDFIGN